MAGGQRREARGACRPAASETFRVWRRWPELSRFGGDGPNIPGAGGDGSIDIGAAQRGRQRSRVHLLSGGLLENACQATVCTALAWRPAPISASGADPRAHAVTRRSPTGARITSASTRCRRRAYASSARFHIGEVSRAPSTKSIWHRTRYGCLDFAELKRRGSWLCRSKKPNLSGFRANHPEDGTSTARPRASARAASR